jgi:serine protease Do
MNSPRSSLPCRPVTYVAVLLTAVSGLLIAVHAAQPSSATSSVALKRDDSPVQRDRPEPASFSSVVKRVSPSVVEIKTETHAHRVGMNGRNGADRGSDGSDQEDQMLRQFFGGRLPQMREPELQNALGSGVIVSPDGYIVTNNHVVEGADRLTVTLSDGRVLTAHVVGRDPQTDIAVVRVDAKDLPAITFASSAKVDVGDRVLAVGNPFGIGETVTTGIVSAKSRRAGLGLAYEDFIQTDAAINPGNSGGALVDIDGRLVGINTAILSHSGGSQGVGLAVPADLVRHVVDSLVAHGKVVRGYLGVGVQDVTPELADSFGLKNRAGALIADVQPNSPAAKAGLASGDVITSIDGQPVDGSSHLSLVVGESAPGAKLALEVLHNGKSEHLTVTTASKPGDVAATDHPASAGDDQGVLNGVAVDDLDEAARQSINLPPRLRGAVITGVAPDSASARAGLRAGDVILEINRQPVTSAKDAVDLSTNAVGKKTLVKVWSHGSTVYLVVDESGATS